MGKARVQAFADWCGQQPPSCCVVDVRGDVHPAQLSHTMIRLFDWMSMVGQRGGIGPPIMLSACRSRERQAQLQRDWDMGLKEGLAVRPVDNSKHLADPFGRCHAFDLANLDSWLYTMGPVVAMRWPAIEWGGAYIPKDIRHFEERG